MRANLNRVLMFAVMVFLFLGCDGSSAVDGGAGLAVPDSRLLCPNADDTAGSNYYGGLHFGNGGDDSAGNSLVTYCGWAIYNGHHGGYGDTLEVSAFGEYGTGVVLTWAYNDFRSIYLQVGWEGKTDRGIGIGDSLEAFVTAYPEAEVTEGMARVTFDPANYNAVMAAYFNTFDQTLLTMTIGNFFHP